MEKQYKKYKIEFLGSLGQVLGAFGPVHLSVFVYAHSKEDAINRARKCHYEGNGGSVGGLADAVMLTLRSNDPHIQYALLSVSPMYMEMANCTSEPIHKMNGKKELLEKLRNWECQEAMDAICGKRDK